MDFLLYFMASFLGFCLAESESPSLRLEGGMSPCAGRVEVYHQQEWGTVCDDDWGMLEAQVVCRQLNCGTAVRALPGAFFGQGLTRIWLDNVNCKGTESSLQQCHHPVWGRHNCRHEEDAGVVCSAATTSLDGDFQFPVIQQQEKSDERVPAQTSDNSRDTTTFKQEVIPPSGHQDKEESDEFVFLQTAVSSKDQDSVRLVGGPGHCSGRVEIFHGNEWGTVCDDNWDIRDAAVVCKQLGCGPAISANGGAKFGPGSGKIWLDDVHCTRVESSLAECEKGPWGTSNCKHDEDASVICAEGKSVTLVNGPGHCAGRVEVYYKNTWGTICDDLWGLTNAQVICKQLGCGTALSAPGAAFFGEGKGPIWLDNVNCTGQESSVLDCATEPWGKHNCRHREDAGVVCSDELQESRPNESDNKPTLPEQGGTAVPRLASTRASGHPEVQSKLPYPKRKPAEDSPTEILGIRLTGGPNRCSGRVELYHNQLWGTVCNDNWGILDALVVCRQLGCGPVVSYNNWYGPGSGPVWVEEMACYGIESSLSQCASQPWGKTDCSHSEDAGVQCQEVTSVNDADVKVTALPPTQSHVHSDDEIVKKTSPSPAGGTKPPTQNVARPHVDCACHTPMAACEPQQLPELVKIMREMKVDFGIFTPLLQDTKHQLQSMASSMREVASSLRQLLELFTVQFSKRSPGEV